MKLRKSANFIDFKFLHVCVQNTLHFDLKILEMVNKIKKDVDKLLLVSKMKKSSILVKYIENFVSVIETKISLSTSVFIFSTIYQILKTKFCVF